MPKKIDDDILFRMVNGEGKSQKEAAAFFRVSPAAICKRLRRLSFSPDAIMEKHNLTEKEKAFCIEKAKGRTNTQAALISYEAGSIQSAKVIGSQLMDKPEIKEAIEDIMDRHGLTKNYRVGRLRTHVDNRDPNISLKALDQSWKLDGSYAAEPHIEQVNYNMLILKAHEIDKEIVKLEKELEFDGLGEGERNDD